MSTLDKVFEVGVAKLLGDTIETAAKHYSEFVKALREGTRRMMDDTSGRLLAFASNPSLLRGSGAGIVV